MKKVTAADIAQAIVDQDPYKKLSENPTFNHWTEAEIKENEAEFARLASAVPMVMIRYLSYVTGRYLTAAEISACNALAAMPSRDDDDAPYDHDSAIAEMQAIAEYAAGKE